MKKTICIALGCLLLLAGCAKGGTAAFDPEQVTQALLDSGAFSETLEELDPTLLFPEGKAGEVEAVLSAWVDGQLEAERSYRPAEAEKLEHAILETRGNTVLLVVAADWEKARAAIPTE